MKTPPKTLFSYVFWWYLALDFYDSWFAWQGSFSDFCSTLCDMSGLEYADSRLPFCTTTSFIAGHWHSSVSCNSLSVSSTLGVLHCCTTNHRNLFPHFLKLLRQLWRLLYCSCAHVLVPPSCMETSYFGGGCAICPQGWPKRNLYVLGT